jgi:putative flippase GtrA
MEVQGRQGVLQELDIPPAGRRRIRDWLKFGLVGASGLIVNQILVVALTELAGIYYVISAILATFGSSTWNFFGADSWAFADRRVNRPIRRRYLAFLGLNLALLVARTNRSNGCRPSYSNHPSFMML